MIFSLWRLEPGGAEGQLGSMAAGNIIMLPPRPEKAQAQTHVVLHNSNCKDFWRIESREHYRKLLARFHFLRQQAAAPGTVTLHHGGALLGRGAAHIHFENVRDLS